MAFFNFNSESFKRLLSANQWGADQARIRPEKLIDASPVRAIIAPIKMMDERILFISSLGI
ncbi:MAG: hypothetical protein L6V93_15850 [Clostridiales bacterium]|nr:MAG: hypothetical protein L6V93_15850 [Clostridiales bacterium]